MKRLENCENNAAELYAIYDALTWTHQNIASRERKEIHIFTDSRYSIDAVAEHSQIKNHHQLVEHIHQEVTSMGSTLVLHWIPSHIELTTAYGKRQIDGNAIADSLASTAARSKRTSLDYKHEYIELTHTLTTMASDLVYNIDKNLKKKWEQLCSQNAGPFNDDFSPTDAQQILARGSVTP